MTVCLSQTEYHLLLANCVCRDNLHPYGISSPRQFPTKGLFHLEMFSFLLGCYVQVAAESNYARAGNNCKSNYYNGFVSIDEDSAKTAFLRALFSNNSVFYIGLTWNAVSGGWEWPDGTIPGSYQPWVGGKVPDGSGGQCVYLTSNSQWQQIDCLRKSHCFVPFYCQCK